MIECQTIGIPADKKYESEGGPSLKACFDAVIRSSIRPVEDKRRLVEWTAFNILSRNMDGHAKNLSLLNDGDGMRLAPFYDLLCTAVYPNLSQRSAFKIGGENRPQWIMERHWDRFACDIGETPESVVDARLCLVKKMKEALPEAVAELHDQRADENEGAMEMMCNINSIIRKSLIEMEKCISVRQANITQEFPVKTSNGNSDGMENEDDNFKPY